MSDDKIDYVVEKTGDHFVVWLRQNENLPPDHQSNSLMVGMGRSRSDAIVNACRLLYGTLTALSLEP